MDHVTYGLFDDKAHAIAALHAIEASGTPRRHCGVVVESGHFDPSLLGALETGASEGFKAGIALGGIFGAILGGAMLGPAGLVGLGAIGAAYGGAGGALAGAGSPERKLARLAKELEQGKVLLVVEAPNLACRDRADSAMRANDGEVHHKPFL